MGSSDWLINQANECTGIVIAHYAAFLSINAKPTGQMPTTKGPFYHMEPAMIQ